jgi:hypothetical protein
MNEFCDTPKITGIVSEASAKITQKKLSEPKYVGWS